MAASAKCPRLGDYSLQLAKKFVEEYGARDDQLTQEHVAAMQCRDCEEFLEAGIEAQKWLRQSANVLREAARAGIEVSRDAKEALDHLYRAWLRPCPNAEARIREQEERGFKVANLAEFQAARDHVMTRVQAMDLYATMDEAFRGGVFDDAFWAEAGRLQSH